MKQFQTFVASFFQLQIPATPRCTANTFNCLQQIIIMCVWQMISDAVVSAVVSEVM